MKTAKINLSSIPFTEQDARGFQDLLDALEDVYGNEPKQYAPISQTLAGVSQTSRNRSEPKNFAASFWSASATHH
jgi:hypothetical protein